MVRGSILAALALIIAVIAGGAWFVFGDTYTETPAAIESKLAASSLPAAMIGTLDAKGSATVARSIERNADGKWLIWTYSIGGEPFARYSVIARPALLGRTIVNVQFQSLPTELGQLLDKLSLTSGYSNAAAVAAMNEHVASVLAKRPFDKGRIDRSMTAYAIFHPFNYLGSGSAASLDDPALIEQAYAIMERNPVFAQIMQSEMSKSATAARSAVMVRGDDGKLVPADQLSKQAYDHAQKMMDEMK